jgi:hypothetical protein
MRGIRQYRCSVSLGLALLLSVVAAAPLWHGAHRAEESADRHTHPCGVTRLCGPTTLTPEADCALCQTVRLLSTALAGQVAESIAPPPDAAIDGEHAFRTQSPDGLAACARAPPLS